MLVLSLYGIFNASKSFLNDKEKAMVELMNISNIYICVSMALEAILALTLLCLLIGISKDKVSLMKPFKIIYIIYLVIMIGLDCYNYVILDKAVKNVTDAAIDKYYSTVGYTTYRYGGSMTIYDINDPTFSYLVNPTEARDSFKIVLEESKSVLIFGLIISLIIDGIYYITTINYIKSVEKEEKEVEDIKNMENAN